MTRTKKLLFLIPVAVAMVSATYIVQSDKEAAIDQILMQSLKNVHYSPMEVNDKFSEKVLKLYLQRLDYNKKFLIQSDVDELQKFNHSIDDDVNNGTFIFFDKSLEIINKRVDEAKSYYTDILSKPFDFNSDEEVQLDAEKLTYAKNKDALKEEWRKSLKYQTLSRVIELMDNQTKAKEKKKSDQYKNNI